MRRLRLIFIVGRFPELSETFIVRKALGLAQEGHSVLIMSRRTGDRLLSNIRHPNLAVEFMPVSSGPYSSRELLRTVVNTFYYILVYPAKSCRLWSMLRSKSSKSFVRQFLQFIPFVNKEKYDIIHAEFMNLGISYHFISSFLSIPYALSCRGADMHLMPLTSEESIRECKKVLQSVSMIHCVSEEMKLSVEKLAGRLDNIVVNRPAVTSDILAVQSTRKTHFSTIPRIVSTGRLVWKKGFDYLLKAFAILKERGIVFQAEIIGGGTLYNELSFSLADLALDDCVVLTGPLAPSTVLERLFMADIFVLSSVEEGISNAALEAMASGLPVVSTRSGGMEEVVQDGFDGLLVPVRDPVAIANAIAILIERPDLRKIYGDNAKRKIDAHFTLDRQVKIFEEAYGRLADRA